MEDSIYMQQINDSVKEMLQRLSGRFSETDLQRIADAYEFAKDAHKCQKRKSGEPYIIHPVNVARIVAEELELGANPIIAAFLHDVVEDTPRTIFDVKNKFGEDVAFLVGVVTKEKKERYDQSKQIDNFRQILASLDYDIRALLIKLADRLHNMRTLSSMRPDKQMKIAGETDYFYAPLANRLGLYHIKSELETLSFKYRCPHDYEVLNSQLEHEKKIIEASLEGFTTRMCNILQSRGITARTEIRYRMPYSIWRKMRSNECDFNHVDGKHYIRIIYPANPDFSEKNMSLRIYSALTDIFKERPGSVSNYIDSPKENGYQSFHVKLLSDMGRWEEIHISSERMVRNSRLGCAAERTEENVMSWLEKFKSLLQDVATHTSGIEFMEGVTSSFYNDDILVFTPQGTGVILPKNSSAIDFAYEIHSNIGEHARYARVNGKLCSMKTMLHRGDCVEIGIGSKPEPTEAWLDHVLTYKAKKQIRQYLNKVKKIEFKRCPFCHPLPGDEVIGFQDKDGQISLHKRNCNVAIRRASQDGDSIVAVNFEENDSILYPVRLTVRAIDRYHLLRDLTYCITEKLHLSMQKLKVEMNDNIVFGTVDFSVHSANELAEVMDSIDEIDGVDEVQRINIE